MSDSQARVRALYGVMQSIENKLGGGEGVEGLYGSINKGGMQKIIDALAAKCGLDSSSRLVDIGAGLGRPLMHALVEPGIASAFGVEIDRIKCDKAAAFLRQTVAELARRGVAGAGRPLEAPEVQCSSIEQITTLDPCTHAYSFWEGVPYDGKMAFGSLFAASRTLRSVAVVQRAMRGQPPAEVMEELGFGKLVLVASFSVSMSGSGRSFTAYVFNRAEQPLPALGPAVVAEQALGELLPTPAASQEPEPARASLSLSQPGSVQHEVAAEAEVRDDSASALPAAGVGKGEQARGAQQPAALGRGQRRAVRSSKVTAAVAAAAAGAAPKEAAAQTRRSSRRAPPAAAAADVLRPGLLAAAAEAAVAAAYTGSSPNSRRASSAAGALERLPPGAQAAAAEAVAAAAAVPGGGPSSSREQAGEKAGSLGRASPAKRGGSPAKPKGGVQKKQSPKKQAPLVLQDARVRRPRAAAAALLGGKGGKEGADQAVAVPSPPRVRRGLLS